MSGKTEVWRKDGTIGGRNTWIVENSKAVTLSSYPLREAVATAQRAVIELFSLP